MTFPRDPMPDATLSLLADGYEFISKRCARLGTDAFRTRLLLSPALCVSGRDAAEMFYGGDHFTRVGAMPATTVRLLQDKGSVQALDGGAHRNRKALFMGLMSEARIDDLVALFRAEWGRRIERSPARRIVLFEALRPVLTAAVCRWAGVPLEDEDDVRRRAEELGAMIDGAGSVGPLNWRGRVLRARNEAWARDVLAGIREGTVAAPPESAAVAIALHRDETRAFLPLPVAGVELINVLRPTVAIGRFVTFAALALEEHPEWRERLRREPEMLRPFVHEVRRLAPFFPFIAGRARDSFEWHGERIPRDAWVILDLYGTNRDPAVWSDPEAFRPERFSGREIGPFDLVPQGGGGFLDAHRCPGEWITIAVVEAAVEALLALDYAVPPQDLSVDLSTMPARPKSGFVIERTADADAPMMAAE